MAAQRQGHRGKEGSRAAQDPTRERLAGPPGTTLSTSPAVRLIPGTAQGVGTVTSAHFIDEETESKRSQAAGPRPRLGRWQGRSFLPRLSLSFQISGAVLSCDSPAAGPRPPALPCVRTALHAALSCGCGSPSSSYRARPVMQGLSVPVVWWPRFPVTARCASWGWSFPRCLRFSLSLEGAGFVSSRAAVVSSQSALPACPAGPWGAE